MGILSLVRRYFGSRSSNLGPQPETPEKSSSEPVVATGGLNYDELVSLDAEDLAEQGIAAAYEGMRELLALHVAEPVSVEEVLDDERGSYSIRYNGEEHIVYSPDLSGSEAESWGRATVAFFSLINSQLAASPVQFFALYSGNDLGGMFLEPERAESARQSLKRRQDWPYIPEMNPPFFGQFH